MTVTGEETRGSRLLGRTYEHHFTPIFCLPSDSPTTWYELNEFWYYALKLKLY